MSNADDAAIQLEEFTPALCAPRYVRHKIRPADLYCTDRSAWLILEESPSFYIVYLAGEGVSLKRKADYEVVT